MGINGSETKKKKSVNSIDPMIDIDTDNRPVESKLSLTTVKTTPTL
jgi:hypothetical protein